jgi:HlyD family secretion protein
MVLRDRISWIISIAILLFIGTNIILLLKFDEKVPITKSVNHIATTHTSDMQTLHKTTGVVAPANEIKVYYDPDIGKLDEIFVEKGQNIEVGASLLAYSNTDFEASQDYYEDLIDQAEEEVDMLKETISELYSLKNTVEAFSPSEEEKEEEVKQVQKEKAARIDVEIASKNHEKQQVEAKIEGYETQLDSITDNKKGLTVTSPISGVVKEVSHSENGPIITIYETPFVVKGELTEKDTSIVAEGQKAFFTSEVHSGQKFEGSIMEISKIPVSSPELNQPSYYPFSVKIEEESELLQAGFHVEVAVVTEEKENAIVVPKNAILSKGKSKYVFVIAKGKVDKRKVQFGLQDRTKIEITKGVQVGDLIITKNLAQLKDGYAVVKPLELSNLSKEAITDMPKRKITRLVAKGFFN